MWYSLGEFEQFDGAGLLEIGGACEGRGVPRAGEVYKYTPLSWEIKLLHLSLVIPLSLK